jgi:hypothetical protein
MAQSVCSFGALMTFCENLNLFHFEDPAFTLCEEGCTSRVRSPGVACRST